MLRNFFGLDPEIIFKVDKLDKLLKRNIDHKYKIAIGQYLMSYERNKLNNPAQISPRGLLKRFKEFYSREDLINIFEIIDEKL